MGFQLGYGIDGTWNGLVLHVDGAAEVDEQGVWDGRACETFF